MRAEILSTGDELRSGAVLDSNSAHIAQQLEDAGIEVMRHTCVGDDVANLVAAMTEIGNRADIAVVTGGLGPTPDDVSALSAARAAGAELILDMAALASVQEFFRTRKLPLSPSNEKQAMLPQGAEPLPNPVGTAPGFSLKIQRCQFFFLPGVPSEMQLMFAEQVLPRIAKLQGKQREFSGVRNIVTFGLTESATGEKLAHFAHNFSDIKLGLRVMFPEIHIKLYARSTDEDYLNDALARASEWILQKIGKRVVSLSGDSMEAVIGELLRRDRATLAVAESCTGGLISHRITSIPGSSDYLLLSAVAYSNDAKLNVLGVPSAVIDRCGAVHEETAACMAQGVRQVAGATYGLSTTGIAGPTGGTDAKPVGTVCIGLAGPEGTFGKRYHFPFQDRSMNKQIFSHTALNRLRLSLIEKTRRIRQT
ncbi:MAG: CinA family nicotinamide mononucleotide deamidase-related protein [Desulfobacterales bacterium]|jgi:nicotinamide-nucleotide amidase